MKITKNYLKIFLLVILFVLIRTFEETLFYDPFLAYFRQEIISNYPTFSSLKLVLNLLLRYSLNTLISMGIIYFVFEEIAIIKFSIILYLIIFILLIITFFIFLYYFDYNYNKILFNIRRLIIQPILILLFLPAFYYQKKLK